MTADDAYALAITVGALVSIGAAFFVSKWTRLAVIAVAAYIVATVAVSVLIGNTALPNVDGWARHLGGALGMIIVASIAYGIRRGLGAGWRRIRRPSADAQR